MDLGKKSEIHTFFLYSSTQIVMKVGQLNLEAKVDSKNVIDLPNFCNAESQRQLFGLTRLI